MSPSQAVQGAQLNEPNAMSPVHRNQRNHRNERTKETHKPRNREAKETKEASCQVRLCLDDDNNKGGPY